jgi:hypothetical protein
MCCRFASRAHIHGPCRPLWRAKLQAAQRRLCAAPHKRAFPIGSVRRRRKQTGSAAPRLPASPAVELACRGALTPLARSGTHYQRQRAAHAHARRPHSASGCLDTFSYRLLLPAGAAPAEVLKSTSRPSGGTFKYLPDLRRYLKVPPLKVPPGPQEVLESTSRPSALRGLTYRSGRQQHDEGSVCRSPVQQGRLAGVQF